MASTFGPNGKDLPTRVAVLREDAATTVVMIKRRLVERCLDLADRLTREAGRIQKDASHIVNSLGIIQGRALDIDLLCADLNRANTALANLDLLA